MKLIVCMVAAFAALVGVLGWGGSSPAGVVPVGEAEGQYIVGGSGLVVTATATATATGTGSAPQCSKYKKVADVDCKDSPKNCEGELTEINCGTQTKIEADSNGSINAKNVTQSGTTCLVCGVKNGTGRAVCIQNASYSTWASCKVKTATLTATATVIGGIE